AGPLSLRPAPPRRRPIRPDFRAPTPKRCPMFRAIAEVRALQKGSFQMWHSSQSSFFRGALRPVLLAAAAFVSLAGQASAWDMRVCADPDRLPFSHEDMSGFENRIAEILA